MTASQWEQDGVASGDWTKIGGHSNAEGAMYVYRTPDGVVKTTEDEYNAAALQNEKAMLIAMTGTGYTPEVRPDTDREEFKGRMWKPLFHFVQTDAGVTEPIVDGEKFRRHMIHLVGAIRDRGLRHGDLTGPNLVFRGDRPTLLDWQESHPIDEKGPQKQPWTDSFMAMRDVAGIADLDGHFDTPRVARRWMAVLTELGAHLHTGGLRLDGHSFVDFGCYVGDFPALAAVEGMAAWGVDAGGFRTGENSIHIGNDLWRTLKPRAPTLVESDIFDFVAGPRPDVQWDVSMMFSTFPYLVEQRGLAAATSLVRDIIERSGAFFFETQLIGDGPGDQFVAEADVGNWLQRLVPYGQVKALEQFAVWGRPASRTVFVVRKGRCRCRVERREASLT